MNEDDPTGFRFFRWVPPEDHASGAASDIAWRFRLPMPPNRDGVYVITTLPPT